MALLTVPSQVPLDLTIPWPSLALEDLNDFEEHLSGSCRVSLYEYVDAIGF